MKIIGAKKSLGQNFLKSQKALDTIIEVAKISKEDVVLEIGPGRGALTQELLNSGAKVIAIEKDDELFSFLQNYFAHQIKSGQLKLIHDDVMEIEVEKIVDTNYKIVANIPYNITGQIIRRFLTATKQPSQMVLMVQKEVAERIVARDDKESLLSMSIKVFGKPRYIQTVKAGSFEPRPKVDSAIISIENISRQKFEATKVSEQKFFEILRAGFAHKRKKLASNIKKLIPTDSLLPELRDKRAEDLQLEDWLSISEIFSNK